MTLTKAAKRFDIFADALAITGIGLWVTVAAGLILLYLF